MTATVDLSTTDRAPATAGRMAAAAIDFLAALNDQQRETATLPFGDDRRYIWDYRPPESTPRNGLRLINMTLEQQVKALALLEIGLSTRGAYQVRQIIDLEVPLLAQERMDGRVTPFARHPEQYSVCIFGDPSGRAPWAWHVGGHHVGVHFTVVDGDRIASVPLFFGANPAEVRHGPTAGQRTLPEEEDLARMLLRSLPPDQKRIALISPALNPVSMPMPDTRIKAQIRPSTVDSKSDPSVTMIVSATPLIRIRTPTGRLPWRGCPPTRSPVSCWPPMSWAPRASTWSPGR